MEIQARIPNKRLLAYCEKHADKIDILDHNRSGWDGDRAKYEIILADGWHFHPSTGNHKYRSEFNGNDLIDCLKTIEPCIDCEGW